MKGIINNIRELKKRGSGLLIVFVEDGTVSETRVTFSDEHPEDLALTKQALRAVCNMGAPEVIYKQMLREKRGE